MIAATRGMPITRAGTGIVPSVSPRPQSDGWNGGKARCYRFPVTFRWKDYRDKGHKKLMTLTALEFIRRFLMHVVPAGFVRIRHYGFLANRNRSESIALIRSKVPSPSITALPKSSDSDKPASTPDSLNLCPVCKRGKMVRVALLLPVNPLDSS